MTLTQIRYFIEAATQMSFAKASANLFVVPQVVSRQIKSLEDELGFQLFERHAQKINLTQGGEILFKAWSAMITHHDSAISSASGAMNKTPDLLRIGIVPIRDLMDLLSEGISRISPLLKHIDFSIETYSFRELNLKLLNKELDCIISLTDENPNLSDTYIQHPFHSILPSIILSKSHPLYKENIRLADLKEAVFYIFSQNYSRVAEKNILADCRKNGFSPKKIEYFDDINSMEIALHSGKGISVCYGEFFRNTNNKLVIIPFDNREISINTRFSISYPKNLENFFKPLEQELLRLK